MQQQHIIEKTFIRAGNSPKAKTGGPKHAPKAVP